MAEIQCRRKAAWEEIMLRKLNRWFFTALLLFGCPSWAWTQPAATAGTLEGTVVDPSGAVLVGASAEIVNRLSGYHRSTTTDSAGHFRFDNVPPNPYHLDVNAPGFAEYSQDLQVRGAIPVSIRVPLVIAGGQTAVNVEAYGADLVENVPYAHSDVDRSTYAMLPAGSPGSGLSNAVTLSTPGVAADSNGLFHPLGDHAQVTFSIDGQPVSDQQSKQFSTQVPLNAIQSMEVITGAPPAEYGDKTSLVLNAVTRSALGQAKPSGSFAAQYGSFGTISEESTLGMGSVKLGNFLAINADRSGRFLDTPELRPIHAIGNDETIFDRFDYRPRTEDAFHLNLIGARNWFQVPNTYDQPGQDQRQRALTLNVAPGYQHVFSVSTLFTANAFFRQDRVNYYPSRDPFGDTPASVSQRRSLSNWGTKAGLSHVHGRHTLKFGLQLMQTRLHERFTLGVTDPALGLQPGLAPFDLTRGGQFLQFFGKTNINQAAFFGEDSMALGNLNLTAGLRIDRYQGLSDATGVQPRIGVSYLVKPLGTVLRAAYSRALETPYNENLILSSATGQGGLATNVFGAFASTPIQPGRRNQYNVGIQQSLDRLLRVDADYFWKFTENAFDFGVLLNTPIQFPISWRQSKIDGVAVRLSTPSVHGFQSLVTMGHTRARYFGPSNGGLIFNSPLETAVFRIDHDQAFEQTTNLRYQRPKGGPWLSFTWRYDSGLVAGAVPDLKTALGLTAAQQAAIGFFCGGVSATPSNPITSCGSSSNGATRLRIPTAGTADPDRNPPRIAPRHIFSIATGSDNLFHTDPVKTTLRFEVVNLTNQVALYNFLSTFSGTHFVAPRTFQAELGIAF
jgi:hypothetical protein